MRELKFRAWLVPYGRSDGKPSKRNKPYYDYFDLWDEFGDDTWFTGASVECFEQYTGLKDKNGKEIYEGDIVDNGYSPICEIRWSEHFTAFEAVNEGKGYVSNIWYVARYGEVIGNIHETPELLEVKE